MRYPCSGLAQRLRLARIDVNGMRDDGARAEDAEFMQAINGAQAAFLQAVVLIGFVFGRVDVKSMFPGVVSVEAAFERRVRERERRMQAETGRDLRQGI